MSGNDGRATKRIRCRKPVAGRASPAWIRYRFFGNEGKNQRPDVLGNSAPDPGEAPGVPLRRWVGGEGVR